LPLPHLFFDFFDLYFLFIQPAALKIALAQGDDGKKAWEISFADTFGTLLGLPPASVLETDTHDFLKLFQAKGLMGNPSFNNSIGLARRSVAGRWTSTAAFGGTISQEPTDAIWPRNTAPPLSLGSPGYTNGRESVSPPDGRPRQAGDYFQSWNSNKAVARQAPDPHVLRVLSDRRHTYPMPGVCCVCASSRRACVLCCVLSSYSHPPCGPCVRACLITLVRGCV
jgi:hypothetical protein